jgi:NADH:ubiquinone oxidoreductase subunit F (NADH-binding)/(2Fe-2S) ferredoxin/Pyruvate/2-oxoacid:ferredoxin oxidoreductase delta subunit
MCVRDSLNAFPESNHLAELVEIKVSMATCGIAAGAKEVNRYLAALLERERIPARIVQTGCMGYCYAEPTIEVTLPGGGPVVFGYVNNARVDDIVTQYIGQGIMPEDAVWIKDRVQAGSDAAPRQLHIALRNCGHIDPENIDDYIKSDGYLALGKALTQMTPDEVIKTIIDSGLRGRGGGGFPTGLKWQITRRAEGSRKYVVCNADEGDPGAFMDRSILEGDPHTVIEAMVINGYCTGADKGVIYIRAEYPLAVERLKVAMQQAKACGLLGERIFGTDFSFDIEIRYGAGAFVCGEETALIHSMEGERGEASVKPPFPSEKGYKGFPTNVNNVETYANIPAIILKGADWFSAIGTAKSKGTKVFALAGKINKVGLVEVPMGTTLREVIFEIGGGIKDGKKFKAVQTGGPSGGCLTEKHLDLPIDYDNLLAAGSMMGSGGMIVMDEDDCMVAMAQFYLDFSVEESCGKCTPCRIGNKRLHEILQKITSGAGEESDLERLRNLAMVIKDTALCGLGQTSPNPVLSTMDNFYDEYIAHVRDQACPAHRCRKLTQYFIDPEKCTGCTLCSRACSVDAIKGERKAPHVIDPILCVRCGTCFDKCRFGAVYVL